MTFLNDDKSTTAYLGHVVVTQQSWKKGHSKYQVKLIISDKTPNKLNKFNDVCSQVFQVKASFTKFGQVEAEDCNLLRCNIMTLGDALYCYQFVPNLMTHSGLYLLAKLLNISYFFQKRARIVSPWADSFLYLDQWLTSNFYRPDSVPMDRLFMADQLFTLE